MGRSDADSIASRAMPRVLRLFPCRIVESLIERHEENGACYGLNFEDDKTLQTHCNSYISLAASMYLVQYLYQIATMKKI